MGLERLSFSTREDWLNGRGIGVGASESAPIVGVSPWKNSLELWKEKTGAVKQKEITGNEAINLGVRMEPAIRCFFECAHPEYKVEYYAYDMLFQTERPWLFATLDGELTETETGRRGVLEIKTATPNSKQGWDKWKGQIPQYYYTQICHQLLATGYDFVILYAALYGKEDVTIREYRFERADCEEDMKWLLEKETDFWRCVETKEMPGVALSL
jgi:putative phage-type endonuclease